MDVQNSLLYNIDAGNEKQERLGRSLFESVETCSFYSCIIMSGLKPVADQVQVWRERCCDSSDSVPQSPIIGVVQKWYFYGHRSRPPDRQSADGHLQADRVY